MQYGNNSPAAHDLHDIGHYTQLVWDATHKVGCGVDRCHMELKGGRRQQYFLYVCNYCPM